MLKTGTQDTTASQFWRIGSRIKGHRLVAAIIAPGLALLIGCSASEPNAGQNSPIKNRAAQAKSTDAAAGGAAQIKRVAEVDTDAELKSRVAARPAIGIDFKSPDCDFGPEVEAFIAKAIVVREKSGNNHEGAINVAPVDRAFGSLTVNFAFVGWESTGLIFDDPVDEARRELGKAGVRFRREGIVDLGEDAQSIAHVSVASGAYAEYGKSYFSCGF